MLCAVLSPALIGVIHQRGELGEAWPQLVGAVAPGGARGLRRLLGEDRAYGGHHFARLTSSPGKRSSSMARPAA